MKRGIIIGLFFLIILGSGSFAFAGSAQSDCGSSTCPPECAANGVSCVTLGCSIPSTKVFCLPTLGNMGSPAMWTSCGTTSCPSGYVGPYDTSSCSISSSYQYCSWKENGESCSNSGECGSGNCRKAIDSSVYYCAPSGSECSSSDGIGYDTGDVEGLWICSGYDSSVQCNLTTLCNTYSNKFCKTDGTWDIGNGLNYICGGEHCAGEIFYTQYSCNGATGSFGICDAHAGLFYDRDEGEYYCESTAPDCGAGSWNLGGEVAETTCCGDDGYEFATISVYDNSMEGEFTETNACCTLDNKCVHNGICYNSESTPSNIEGGDNDYDYCENGVWYDCQNSLQCSPWEDCVERDCVRVTIAFWSNINNELINEIEIVPGTTTLSMVFYNTGLSPGTEAIFTIYEDDGFLLPDSEIKTITSIVDENENANVSWIITQEDLAATGEIEFEEFYFKINELELESNSITLTVLEEDYCEQTILCSDYKTQELCGGNTCELAGSDTSCGTQTSIEGQTECYYLTDCSCEWNSNTSVCESGVRDILFGLCEDEDGNKYPVTRGKCSFQELTEDDCNDGFLTYSWIASWDWQDNNYSIIEDVPGEEYDEDPEGVFHYPNNKWEKCIDKSQTIPCPAQIQLPFFGIFHLIATLILIVLIYFLIKYGKDSSKE